MNLLISHPLTAGLLLALIRVTLLLSLAWLSHVMLRNRNPGWQIMIWRGTTLAIPAILILSFLIPGWGLSFSELDQQIGQLLPATSEMPLEREASKMAGQHAGTQAHSSTVPTAGSANTPASTNLTLEFARETPQGTRLSLGAIIVSAYATVSTLLGLRLLLQALGLRRLMRQCTVSIGDIDRIRSEVCQRLKLKVEPMVVVSDATTLPFATLIPRPAIIIPREIVTISSASELEHLMAHECLHFAGRDLTWSMAIVILRGVFWFHPLTWGMPEAHRLLCDVRCDLIASGQDRSGYAAMLARFATKLRQGTAPALSLAFARGSETLWRVRRIQSQKSSAAIGRAGQMGGVMAILLIVLVVGSFGVHSLVNQPMFEVNRDELRSVPMIVHGPDGQPIAGAEIIVNGLRTVKERASGHGNRMRNKATTNEKGEATVEYPRFVYEEMETGHLIFDVRHPDYVPFSSQGESVDKPIKVTMEAGRKVRITTKDSSNGARITERLFVIQPGSIESDLWKLQSDGTLESNALDKDLSLLLVVCLREGQPALFSDLIHLETFPKGDCQIDDVLLSPGRVVRGQLSDEVPRPVNNGQIGLTAASSISEQPSYDDSIFWQDKTEIREDGTFEFGSVPREIDIQLIANCDGWVSQSAPVEEIQQRFPYVKTDEHARSMCQSMTISQLFSADQTQPVVVRMEPTATCEFKVQDQNGTDVSDVTVYLSPNAVWSPGPGGIVGRYNKTSAWLGLTPEQPAAKARTMMAAGSKHFQAATNADGIALIRNVPGKAALSASVYHKDLDLAPNDIGNPFFRHYQFSITPGAKAQFSLTVQPKDSVVLGR